MRTQNFYGRVMPLLSILGIMGSTEFAYEPVQEQALTWTANDPKLQWGPLLIIPTKREIVALLCFMVAPLKITLMYF